MRNILIVLFVFQFFNTNLFAEDDCQYCADHAHNAYKYAVEAYNSYNLKDCKLKSMRAIKELSASEKKGYDCSCTAAAKESFFGREDAKEAYYSSNLTNCKYYALRTFKHAGLAQDLADGCK